MGLLQSIQPEFMTRQEIQKRLGISQSTIFRWTAEGYFPRGVKFGKRNAWRITEVDQWIADREAEACAAMSKAQRPAERTQPLKG